MSYSESDFPSIRTLNQFVRELRKLYGKHINHLEITIVKEVFLEDEIFKVQKVFDVYEHQIMEENANEKTCTHKYELLFEPTYLKLLNVPKNTTVSLLYS